MLKASIAVCKNRPMTNDGAILNNFKSQLDINLNDRLVYLIKTGVLPNTYSVHCSTSVVLINVLMADYRCTKGGLLLALCLKKAKIVLIYVFTFIWYQQYTDQHVPEYLAD